MEILNGIFDLLAAPWRAGKARLASERDAQAWASCASELCGPRPDGGSGSVAGSGAADALASATAIYGEAAMRSAMARLDWEDASGERTSPACVALGAPLESGWLGALVGLAPAASFKRAFPVAAMGLGPKALSQLAQAGLGVKQATPLLWMGARLADMPDGEWSARFEAAQAMFEPCSKQEAAACLYLAKTAAAGSERKAAMGMFGQGDGARGPQLLMAWIERWELGQIAREAPALALRPEAGRLATSGKRRL